jgi:hypothetical protein
LSFWQWLFGKSSEQPTPEQAIIKIEPPRIKNVVSTTSFQRSRSVRQINEFALAKDGKAGLAAAPDAQAFKMPEYVRGVLPDNKTKLAMDEYGSSGMNISNVYESLWSEGIGFAGYPYLAELTQRPEYRKAPEIIAEEMTRHWLRIKASGDADLSDKIKEITAAFDHFKTQDVIREHVLLGGFFGLSHIYIKIGNDTDEEVATPLVFKSYKIRPGTLKGFKCIDPTWTAPNTYNSNNPLDFDFYKPTSWFILGKNVHHTRLITLVPNPVPDILKPAYNFGGMSLLQMMKPYVDNWLRTRQSVSDLVQAFTVFVLETNLSNLIQPTNGGGNEIDRAMQFANHKANLGVMIIDKDTEGFQNVTTPLSSLDSLQAQTQEHLCAVNEMPLVKYTGISPSGLNATDDNGIRVFYDKMQARQEHQLSPAIKIMLDCVQLHLFGEIDKNITFEWLPLYQLNEAGMAAVRKINADTAAVLIESGVIAPEEARKQIATDPDSLYDGLEELPDVSIEPPEDDDATATGGQGKETAQGSLTRPEKRKKILGAAKDPTEHVATGGAEGREFGANASA